MLPPFPASRPRRLRRDAFSRALVREHALAASDLIYPVFVLDGENRTEAVASMPGVQRMTIDRLFVQAEECMTLGVPVMALFPVIDPALKTPDGCEATRPEGRVRGIGPRSAPDQHLGRSASPDVSGHHAGYRRRPRTFPKRRRGG